MIFIWSFSGISKTSLEDFNAVVHSVIALDAIEEVQLWCMFERKRNEKKKRNRRLSRKINKGRKEKRISM